MQTRIHLIIFILIFSFHSFGQEVSSNNLQKTKLDKLVHQYVTKLMTENPKVGVSIGVYDNGKMRRYHYGTTERGKANLPTDETVYEIASLTKTFTGALLAKAISEVRIRLIDDIRRYLKEPYPNLEFEGKFISIRDLITHQSGLPRSIPFDPKMWENPDFDTLPYQIIKLEAGYTPKDWLRELHDTKLTRAPGSIEFEYSNIGINLVAIALENIYGKSYEQLVGENFLKPLKMPGSKFVLADVDKMKLAKGYNQKGKEMPYMPDNTRAAGGMKSNIKDMLRYVAFQMNEANPMVKISHTSVWDNKDKTFSRGLGWQMFNDGSLGKSINQDGGAFGFSSAIVLFPEKNMGFVLLSNESGPGSQNALREIASKICEGMTKR